MDIDIDIDKIRKELIGKGAIISKPDVEFRNITDVIDASTALKDPEIRSGAKNNLLYCVWGHVNVKKLSDKHVRSVLESMGEEMMMVYIYPDTKIFPQ